MKFQKIDLLIALLPMEKALCIGMLYTFYYGTEIMFPGTLGMKMTLRSARYCYHYQMESHFL